MIFLLEKIGIPTGKNIFLLDKISDIPTGEKIIFLLEKKLIFLLGKINYFPTGKKYI